MMPVRRQPNEHVAGLSTLEHQGGRCATTHHEPAAVCHKDVSASNVAVQVAAVMDKLEPGSHLRLLGRGRG